MRATQTRPWMQGRDSAPLGCLFQAKGTRPLCTSTWMITSNTKPEKKALVQHFTPKARYLTGYWVVQQHSSSAGPNSIHRLLAQEEKLLPNEACWQHMEACATGAASSSSRKQKTCMIMPNTWFYLGRSSAAQSTLASTTAWNGLACFRADSTSFQRFFREERSMDFFSLLNPNLLGTRGQFTTKHIYLSASPPIYSFPFQSIFKHIWSTKAVRLQLPLQNM